MKNPEGLALAKQLIAKSDVVVENFSARVMASWGLDYPRMKEIRPDIIMASLQAFGQTGPRRDYVSFGPILMAYSGMTYLWRDPQIERPGAGSQTAFPDYIAPSYGAAGDPRRAAPSRRAPAKGSTSISRKPKPPRR